MLYYSFYLCPKNTHLAFPHKCLMAISGHACSTACVTLSPSMAAIQSRLTANCVAFHAWCNIIVNVIHTGRCKKCAWNEREQQAVVHRLKLKRSRNKVRSRLALYNGYWKNISFITDITWHYSWGFVSVCV